MLTWVYHFAFPPAINENSCSTFSSICSASVCVLDFSHSSRCVVVSLIVLICSYWKTHDVELTTVCISFVRFLFRIFALLLMRLLIFLLFSFKRALCILDHRTLSDMSFASIFSRSGACLIPLATSFTSRSFKFNENYRLLS